MKAPKKTARPRRAPRRTFLMQTVTVNLRDGSAVTWEAAGAVAPEEFMVSSPGPMATLISMRPTRSECRRLAELFTEKGNYNPANIPPEEEPAPLTGDAPTVLGGDGVEHPGGLRRIREAANSYPPRAYNSGGFGCENPFTIAQQMAVAPVRPDSPPVHPEEAKHGNSERATFNPDPSLEEMDAIIGDPAGVLAAERAIEPLPGVHDRERYFALTDVETAWKAMLRHRLNARDDDHIEWGRFLAALPERSAW